MHNILVTGGAGFIGSHLVDKLIDKGHRVTIFDSLDPKIHHDGIPPRFLNHRAVFIKGDVRDYKHLKSVVKDKSVIFHFAAQLGGIDSQYELKNFFDTNVGGMANLADILGNSENCCNKLIHASSMACYGGGEYKCPNCGQVSAGNRKISDLKKRIWEPVCGNCANELKPMATRESFFMNPSDVYGLTKKIQEEIASGFFRTYKIPVTALRFFNVFGPRQNDNNPYTGFGSEFINIALNPGLSMKKTLIPEDGFQIRDFISVHDAVSACICAMDSELTGYNVFNVGSGKKRTKLEFISKIMQIIGVPKQVLIANEQIFDQVRNCYADIRRIKKYLGFKPRIKFEDAVAELVNWIRLNNN